MLKTGNIKELTHDQFLCFLLIYASNLDYVFSDTEEAFILKRFRQETFDEMNELFNENTDYSCLKIIMYHKKAYFNTQEKLNNIMALLNEVFAADGDVSRIEKNFLPFFIKMKDLDVYES